MGKPFEHQYYTAEHGSSHGEMACGVCGLPIVSGDYRVYKKSKNYDWGYHTQHRACCADDPQWKRVDADRVRAKDREELFAAEARAFVDRWGETDLSEFAQ